MKRIAAAAFVEACSQGLLLDVRSPGEYSHAHLPGAYNLPLFTDEERKQVGTAYKQQSRELAIKIGLDFFGPKMRRMVEEVEAMLDLKFRIPDKAGSSQPEIRNPKPEIFLYCWRGGMRSGAVAWLLNLYGFDVTLLEGGYKAFRQWTLQTLSYPFRLQVLGGYSGSGKTEILAALRHRGEAVVDLEALASHKGSAFGHLGLPAQPSQEMFENRLATELSLLYQTRKKQRGPIRLAEGLTYWNDGPIWVEDESQRLGHVNLPKPFWENLQRSPRCFLDVPFESRLQNILKEYSMLDPVRLADAISRIRKRLGGLETAAALRELEAGNHEACFRILLLYYDKQYDKGRQRIGAVCGPPVSLQCEQPGPVNIDRILATKPTVPAHA